MTDTTTPTQRTNTLSRKLWRLIPLRLRSRWSSPYDNWLRGYTAGMDAGLRRAEARQERGERIR